MDKFHIPVLVCHLLYILKRTEDTNHSFKLMQLQELTACQASLSLEKFLGDNLFETCETICTILLTDMTFT